MRLPWGRDDDADRVEGRTRVTRVWGSSRVWVVGGAEVRLRTMQDTRDGRGGDGEADKGGVGWGVGLTRVRDGQFDRVCWVALNNTGSS